MAAMVVEVLGAVHQLLLSLEKEHIPGELGVHQEAPAQGGPEPTTPVAPPALGQEDPGYTPRARSISASEGPAQSPAPFEEELGDDLAAKRHVRGEEGPEGGA